MLELVLEEGPREGTPAKVLEHARVDGEGVIPAFPIQDLKKHDAVAEKWFEAAIQDLDYVGFGDTAGQLVDELCRRLRRDRLLQTSTRLEPRGGGGCRGDPRRRSSRVAF
jgi:hypothetical protein